jgi:hypothetical protein
MQAQQPASVTRDEVLKSGKYFYNESNAATKDEAVKTAKTALVQKINEETGSTVELQDINDKVGIIIEEIRNHFFVTAYFKKEANPQPTPDTTQQDKKPVPQQGIIQLSVTDISNYSITQKINFNASALLTELNAAYFSNRAPNVGYMSGISKDAITSVHAMWEVVHLTCTKDNIIERGLNIPGGGYQVRNIPVQIKYPKAKKGDELTEKDSYREIVINFDNNGKIDDVYFCMEKNEYKEFYESENTDVIEASRKAAIRHFLDRFRDAHVRKDIEWLAKIYSNDALIITGKVIRQTKSTDNILAQNGFSKDKIQYVVQTKKEYINKLKWIFKNHTRVDVQFFDVDVKQHTQFHNMYGVQLEQHWTNWRTESTKGYHDKGYLFLLIDFKDGMDMEIHVRTWQPDKINGKPLPEEEKYGIDRF